jgi:EAL domain-containing protein (putative c-di-GMP-specific phosphodiesterase class I)/CheY-like chemotaxis protein
MSIERRSRPDMSTAPTQIPNMAGVDVTSTVVIVDDTAANVILLTRLLDLAGITRVHGFTDPREAVAFCAESLPDLVLLDLHMPHLDGFAVMDSLQLMVPADGFLPVLVLTADVNVEVRERALLAGAKDFLTKPFDRTEVLLRVANLLETRALYRRLERHNESLQATIDDHLAEERRSAADQERRHARIDEALAPGGFAMVFQPVADLTTASVVGVEALARFGCEPLRPPNVWFAEADHLGRGTELELAAIRAALDRMEELRPDLFLAVNASPATAATDELGLLLDRYPAHRVVLELTEHTRVDDYDGLLAALDRLKHLLRINPHMLKLDTALTHGIDHDPVRRSLAAALVTFARETGATIIAEGIETPGELDTLQRLGIPWGQGYHLARPAEIPPGLRLPALAARSASA